MLQYRIRIATVLVLLCAYQGKQTILPSFSLTISAKTAIQQGSDVKIRIALTNTSTRKLSVLHEKANEIGELVGFSLDVRDTNNIQVPLTAYGKAYYNHELALVVAPYYADVQPGQTLEDWIVVSKLYDLSKPGKYAIQVQRTDEDTSLVIKSNVLPIIIAPTTP